MDYTYVIRLRRNTHDGWVATNPILADGEPAYITDLNQYKIGDGVTAYVDLPLTASLPGDPATVNIGTTFTGDPGTAAEVINTGTQNDAILEFTIPEGEKGDKGDKGDTGDPGPPGDGGSYLEVAGGSMAGNIDMQSNRIQNSADPVDDTDLANKRWVLANGGTPSDHKHDQDDLDFTDSLSMDGQRISDVAAPEADNDVATASWTQDGLAEKASVNHNHAGTNGKTPFGWKFDTITAGQGNAGDPYYLWTQVNLVGSMFAFIDAPIASDIELELQYFDTNGDYWGSVGGDLKIPAGSSEASALPLLVDIPTTATKLRPVITKAPTPPGTLGYRDVSSMFDGPVTGFTLSHPSGVQEGDLLVAVINRNNNANITPPDGYVLDPTEARSDPVSPIRTTQSVYTAIYTAGLGTTWTMDFTSMVSAVEVAVEGAKLEAVTGNDNPNSNVETLALPSTTMGDDGIALVIFSLWGGGSNGTPHVPTYTGFTFDGEAYIETDRPTSSNQGTFVGWMNVTNGQSLSGTFEANPPNGSGLAFALTTGTVLLTQATADSAGALRVQCQIEEKV